MSQIEFDENIARSLEQLYSTADVLRRGAIVRSAVSAPPGDAVLDAGCGPGFYVAELLDEVGEGVRVVGIDGSPHHRSRNSAGAGITCGRSGETPSLPIRQYVRVLSFWFSGVAALAWVLVAVLQFNRDEPRFAVLAGVAALCFAAAFVLRLVERRSRRT